MMIPLFVLLLLYVLFLVVFVVFYIINIYHIIGTGTFTKVSFFVVFLIFLLVLITSYSTWLLLSPVDWSQPLLDFGETSRAPTLSL